MAAKKGSSEDYLNFDVLEDLAAQIVGLENKNQKKWSKKPALKRGVDLSEIILKKFPEIGDEISQVALWVDLLIHTREQLTYNPDYFVLVDLSEAIEKLKKFESKNSDQFEYVYQWVDDFGCLFTEGSLSDIGGWFYDWFTDVLVGNGIIAWDYQLEVKNPTKEKLAKLAEGKLVKERVQAALNPQTQPSLLKKLAKDKSVAVRMATAKNASLTSDVLDLLAQDDEACVRQCALENPSVGLESLQSATSPEGKASLASSDKADAVTLQKLAKESDDSIREAVAENVNTPADVLKILAKDKSSDVRQSVAGNPHTPLEVLKILVKDKDEYVRGSLGYRSDLDEELFELLARDKSTWVRTQIAENVDTPKSVLALLAKDKDSFIRETVLDNRNLENSAVKSLENPFIVNFSLAVNPSTPVKILEKYCSDNAKEYEEGKILSLAMGVAYNPKIPGSCVTKLLATKDEEVLQKLAENPGLPEEHLSNLIEQSVKKGRANKWRIDDRALELGLATNPMSPPEYLSELVNHVDIWVVTRIAKNINCPLNLLSKFGKDSSQYIRQAVAENPSAPWALLHSLLKDEDNWLQVASNPATQSKDLTELAGKKGLSDWILQSIAQNPSASEELILKLAKHKDSYIRFGVVCNPSTPSEVREKILNSFLKLEVGSTEHSYIARCPFALNEMLVELAERYIDLAAPGRIELLGNIGANPSASQELLSDLANERNAKIRASVARNPNTPVVILELLAR